MDNVGWLTRDCLLVVARFIVDPATLHSFALVSRACASLVRQLTPERKRQWVYTSTTRTGHGSTEVTVVESRWPNGQLVRGRFTIRFISGRLGVSLREVRWNAVTGSLGGENHTAALLSTSAPGWLRQPRTLRQEEAAVADIASRIPFALPLLCLARDFPSALCASGAGWIVAADVVPDLALQRWYVYAAPGWCVQHAVDALLELARGAPRLQFLGVEEAVMAALVKELESRTWAVSYCRSWPTYVLGGVPADAPAPVVAAPTLSLNDARIVDANWDLRSAVSLHVIAQCITSNLSAGVRGPSGELLAWGMMQPTGCVSIVGCLPEHRGRGYAYAVMHALASKWTGPTWSSVLDSNSVSVHLHTKLGFRPTSMSLAWCRMERTNPDDDDLM